MKNNMNIFIGCDFPETYIFYQINLVYEFFKQNGYTLVKAPIDSDVIILSGIPFNTFEEVKALLIINYYLKKYSNKEIILIGHMSDMINGLDKIKKIKCVGLNNLSEFNNLFNHKVSITDIKTNTIRFFIPLKIQEIDLMRFGYPVEIRSYYKYTQEELKITINDVIKGTHDISRIEEYDSKYSYLEDKSGTIYIQTCSGCLSKCSYCIISKVGSVRSRPLNEIITEISNGLFEGKKNITIMDQDTGSYGVDIGLNFTDLLNEINKISGDFKIRIRFFEPGRLEKLYKKIDLGIWKKIIRFGVPLQTTSQRILKLMNRNYNIQKIISIVENIKEINKTIVVNTTIMYGFPTETFEEFKDYFRMLKYFDSIDFLMYGEKKELKLSKINKNTLGEIYQKYIYYKKIQEKFPEKMYDYYHYYPDLSISQIVKLLY